MPRRKRTKSESGIYHVMLRGMNKQDIFHDFEDFNKFIKILDDSKEKYDFVLYAYCLMTNHVHLLIKQGSEPLETIFKSIGIKYVYYYNLKYKRSGSLFQDRFKSLPVDDDEYFISALRYIHNNPVKASMVSHCGDYQYSSFNDYINNSGITDKSFVNELMSIGEYMRMHGDTDMFTHLETDMFDKTKLTALEAEAIVFNTTNTKSKADLLRLSKDEINRFVPELYKNNLSINQISELLGLTYYNTKKIIENTR